MQYGEIGSWSLVEAKLEILLTHRFSLWQVGRIKIKMFEPWRVKWLYLLYFRRKPWKRPAGNLFMGMCLGLHQRLGFWHRLLGPVSRYPAWCWWLLVGRAFKSTGVLSPSHPLSFHSLPFPPVHVIRQYLLVHITIVVATWKCTLVVNEWGNELVEMKKNSLDFQYLLKYVIWSWNIVNYKVTNKACKNHWI